jgi:predicted exporter/2-polyprenyl-3-methyl-5-hydroxy-6-metoxy-1,4-benzoquinol methylase
VPKLLAEARKVESAFAAGAIRVSVSGAHRISLENATMIQADSTRTSIIATVAVAALMLLAYRRRCLSLLGLLPTAFGGLAAVLFFYFTGDAVSGIAIGCGSILIGVTVDYGIYVLYHSDDSPPADRLALARAVAAMGPTVTFGALTTLSAFLVMFASPVSGHRQLGVFGVVAVGTAALVALVILPLFIPAKPTQSPQSLPLTRLMARLFALRLTQPKWTLPVLGLLSLVALLGILRLRFDGDLNRFNGVRPEAARDERQIRETWGKALSLTTIVVNGKNRDEALQKNETVYRLLTGAAATNLVEGFSSIAPLVPSGQSRAANLQSWKDFWTPVRQHQLSNSLFAAASELGFRPEAFSGFLGRIASPARTETLASPALSRLVGEYSDSDESHGSTSFLTLVKINEVKNFRAVQGFISRAVPGTLLLNKAALGEEITRIARRGLPVFGALVAALNFLLLFLFLGRVWLVAVTLLPMAAGVLWSLGLLGLFGVPIDMSNFIFVILVVGLGGDYSLFLVTAELDALRGNAAHTASTGGAVTMCALTTIFGVGVLVLAEHPALFSIGLAALLGISLSLVATLLLVPMCMRVVRLRAERLARQAFQSAPGKSSTSPVAVARLYHYQGPYVTQFVYWKMRVDPVFKVLGRVVPKSCAALDLGCGFGLAAHWLTFSSEQRSVIGFDNDGAKVRVAQSTAAYNPRVRFEQKDVLKTEYPETDCVLMCDVLHYLPHEHKAEVLRKAAAALHPGGLLVLRDALRENSRRHRLVAISEKLGVLLGQNKTAQGLHFETRESHLELLGQAGFEVVQSLDNAGLGSNVLLVCRKRVLGNRLE